MIWRKITEKKIIIGCSHVRLRGMLLWTTWCLNNSSGCLLMSPINTCIESPETIFIWNILIKLSTSGRLINNNVHNVQYFHGGAGHIFVNGFSIDWAGVGHIRTLKTRPAWSGVRRPRWRSSCPRPPPWRTSPWSPPASSSPPRPCPPPAGARWQVSFPCSQDLLHLGHLRAAAQQHLHHHLRRVLGVPAGRVTRDDQRDM